MQITWLAAEKNFRMILLASTKYFVIWTRKLQVKEKWLVSTATLSRKVKTDNLSWAGFLMLQSVDHYVVIIFRLDWPSCRRSRCPSSRCKSTVSESWGASTRSKQEKDLPRCYDSNYHYNHCGDNCCEVDLINQTY